MIMDKLVQVTLQSEDGQLETVEVTIHPWDTKETVQEKIKKALDKNLEIN